MKTQTMYNPNAKPAPAEDNDPILVDLGVFWFYFRPGPVCRALALSPGAAAVIIVVAATALMVLGCQLFGRPMGGR